MHLLQLEQLGNRSESETMENIEGVDAWATSHNISSKSQTDAGIQLYFDEKLGVHIFGKSKCC